ncbi:hypothetical protein [Spirulina subsalsa]|uniref:hypothetical protein n=1 Tax=Spirulina subsalsa TaxID=54311 RepID=UPI0003157012|nr:hypothetical protein [Spirulina subsalsa]
MMLLDTHTFLWFILDDPKLSNHADELITDSTNEILDEHQETGLRSLSGFFSKLSAKTRFLT